MKLNSIQALRFVAAMLVVVMHATQGIADNIHHLGSHVYWSQGAAGVHIFFVVSGFVMFITAPVTGGWPDAWAFFKKRMVRVVPPYWLYTFAKVALLMAVAHQGSAIAGFGWVEVLKSIFFIPYQDLGGAYFPILQVGWTLNYEMLFYLVFSVAVLLPAPRWITISIALASLFLYGRFAHDPAPFDFYGRGIIFEFLLGMAAGAFYRRCEPLRIATAVVVVSAALTTIFALSDTPDIDSFFTAGVPSLFLVIGFLSLQQQRLFSQVCDKLAPLGDASYSLYLVHPFVIAALSRLLVKTQMSDSVALLLLCVASVLASLLSYRFIETPLTRFLMSKPLFGPTAPKVDIAGATAANKHTAS